MAEAIITCRNGLSGNSLAKAVITLEPNDFVYDGHEKTQKVKSVVLNGKTLVEGTDYLVVNNTAISAGTHQLAIAGFYKYDGVVYVDWSISKVHGEIHPNETNVTVKGVMGTTKNVTFTKVGNGTLKATVDQGTIATAEIVGDAVKITSVAEGSAVITITMDESTDYTGTSAQINVKVERADGKLTVQPAKVDISGEAGTEATATLSITGDGEITLPTSQYVNIKRDGTKLTLTSKAEGAEKLTINMAETKNYTAASCTLDVNVVFKKKAIYGVEWDGSSSTALSRTDDAALLGDPTPATSGGSGSSPFDDLEPWSGMKKTTIGGNSLVEIPKFWFKWTSTGQKLKLQIATYDAEGFHVSPAHADRGDGKGERDVVYVGRYHCDDNYKSTSGGKPKASMTRANARTGITGLGQGYYMFDYAMLWTIRMLYLVEYKDWDCQKVIGYGCGNNSSTEAMGKSDTMTYHTGTMQSSRTAYGVGVQYRYIEDLWGNVLDWCDGIRFSSMSVYAYNKPSEYSDSSGGTKVATAPSSTSCIKAWTLPTTSGYEWALFPSDASASSSYDTYCADRCSVGSSYVVCFVGGGYYQVRGYGLFCSYSNAVGSAGSDVGARLQYLP